MNLASIIAIIILLMLLIPAIMYLYKNGTCGSCPDKGACSGHCEGKNIKKDKMINNSINKYTNSDIKEKNQLIDEIIKKHRV